MRSKCSRIARFGYFEVDLDREEIRKHGVTLRLPRQSFRVLALLMARYPEVVSSRELRKELWEDAEHGDFEHGLHIAVSRLRTILGDPAQSPRFIQTVPKTGYRFLVPAEWSSAGERANPEGGPSAVSGRRAGWRRIFEALDWRGYAAITVCLATLALTGITMARKSGSYPGQCSHLGPLSPGRIIDLAASPDGMYAAFYRQRGMPGWQVCHARDGGGLAGKSANCVQVYSGKAHVERLVAFQSGVLIVTYDRDSGEPWEVWHVRQGGSVGEAGYSVRLYRGTRRVDLLCPRGLGLLTAISDPTDRSDTEVWYSPDGRSIAGGAGSRKLYSGPNRLDALAVLGDSVVAAFYDPQSLASKGVFLSTGRTDLAQGINSRKIYAGAARVQALAAIKAGLITAYWNPKSGKSWGIYHRASALPADGQKALNPLVYNGLAHVDYLVPYRDGVIAAFYEPHTGEGTGVYFSQDGRNLAGGGSTAILHRGPERVSALASIGDSIVVGFHEPKSGTARGIYYSRDGAYLQPVESIVAFRPSIR